MILIKEITYTIKDENGIHARPAGLLVKTASTFMSEITMEKDGRGVSAKKLFAIMSMNIKQGDLITLRAEGTDEDFAIQTLQEFMNTHF